MPAYLYYKGQLVTPMELRMIKEREQREEEKRRREREKRRKFKIKKEPEAKEEPEEPVDKIEKPIIPEEEPIIKKPSPYDPRLELDFEPYPYPKERTPTPKFVKGVEYIWLRYEQTMGKPSEYVRMKATQTLEKAAEAKKEPEKIYYLGLYSVQRFGAGIYEGLTIPIRPLALGQTLGATIGLARPTARKELLETISKDPLGFASEMAGGFIGGYTFGKGVQYAKTKYQAYKQARFERKYPVEDFLPYEQELLTPQPTQDIDLRSSAFEERAKPVVWEYRGGRKATIPVDQRLPLKEYPDPSRVELMGGKAITDLVTLDEVSRARTVIEPTWTPGLRISDVGPTITQPMKGVSPYWTGLLGMTRAIPKTERDVRTTIRIKEDAKVITEPKISPYQIEYIETISEPTKVVGTGSSLKFMPIQEPIPKQIKRLKQVPISVPIQEFKPIQEQKVEQKPIMAIPPMPIMDMRLPIEPESFKYRPPRKKKKGKGFWGLKTFGEIRVYPIDGLDKMLKELKI